MKRSFVLLAIAFLCIASYAKAARQSDVVINEIAWMGTTDSANNEWIELFNNTSATTDLSGWTLQSSDGKLNIHLKGSISALGFYIMERTDNNSVIGVSADLIYKGALTNTGMDLTLRDSAGNVVDEVRALNGWPSGDNTTKQTMEQTASLAWQTSKSPNGTPKAQNSTGQVVESTPRKTTLTNQTKNLPNLKKPDNNIGVASVENTAQQLTNKNSGELEQTTSSAFNPWLLFLTSVAIIIISLGVILAIKFHPVK